MFLAAIFLSAATATSHPLSVSSSRVVVDGARIELLLRCQEMTLIECLPLDENSDRRIQLGELDAARAEIETYVLAGYRITADPGTTGARALTGKLENTSLVEGQASSVLPVEPLVDLVFRFDAGEPPRGLSLDFRLFRASDALHRDHTQIVWNGAEPAQRVLWVEDPSWTFGPSFADGSGSDSGSNTSALAAFLRLGIEHIWTGYDHIAFLIALLVASRRLRSIVAVVTAFTLAHSITLALAALDVVHVSARLVEPAIALSIAWVALRNVFVRDSRALWPEAFVFGLIHGLGFAGSISETLAAEPQKLAALFGFNAGVELGQLAIVAVLGGLLVLVRKRTAEASAPSVALAPPWLRVSASIVVGILGFYWFVERVWTEF